MRLRDTSVHRPGCFATYPPSVRGERRLWRWDHARLRAAVHRIGFAIAAHPRYRCHALTIGPEAAVAPATAVATPVLGAPRIGDIGARRFDAGGREAHGAQRQSGQDTSHGEPLDDPKSTTARTARRG